MVFFAPLHMFTVGWLRKMKSISYDSFFKINNICEFFEYRCNKVYFLTLQKYLKGHLYEKCECKFIIIYIFSADILLGVLNRRRLWLLVWDICASCEVCVYPYNCNNEMTNLMCCIILIMSTFIRFCHLTSDFPYWKSISLKIYIIHGLFSMKGIQKENVFSILSYSGG